MFRPWLLLALLIAASGTPLRIVEAASDLARLTIEEPDAGEIEAIDGGVGDDSGESIRVNLAHDATPAPLADHPATDFPRLDLPPRPGSGRRSREPDARPPSPSRRRHLLLQRFLC